MKTDISKWVNLKSCPLNSIDFVDKCRQKLSDTGVLLLPQFLLPEALNQTIKEAQARTHLAYFTKKTHNVYLSEPNTSLPETHVFNRQVKSSKGCITTDQIQSESGLHVIYNNSLHRVTPTIGNRTRILVVLAYNNKASVSLFESARMTFFGRLS